MIICITKSQSKTSIQVNHEITLASKLSLNLPLHQINRDKCEDKRERYLLHLSLQPHPLTSGPSRCEERPQVNLFSVGPSLGKCALALRLALWGRRCSCSKGKAPSSTDPSVARHMVRSAVVQRNEMQIFTATVASMWI